MSATRELIARELPSLRDIRHDLHAHPELGYQEVRTSQVVRRELDRLGIKYIADMAGGTGVVAHIPPTSPTSAPAVGLRADMDALPIVEQTSLPYASKNVGTMHACGHDGHTTILLGAARVLMATAHRPNPVTLVFQPAEEGGGGADKLVHEGALDGSRIGPPVGRMFGLHGWPEFALGTIGTRPGPLLASTDEFNVTIRGTQSHAAYPHYAHDPVLCAATCITSLQQIASRNVSPLDSAVVSVCKMNAGFAVNVIPETATFCATLRTLRPETRSRCRARFKDICEHTAAAFGCKAEVHLDPGYPVTHNDPELTEWFFAQAKQVLGAEKVTRVENPTMGGEDFSYYAQKVPSVFFCLGLKRQGQDRYPTLHQPDFDFNDDAMPIGIEMFVKLATAVQ
jgi:amidohydrolase